MQGRLRLALYCFVPGLSSVYDTGVYPSVFGAKLFGNVPEGRFLCLQNKRCDMMGLKSVLFSGVLLSAMAVGVQATPETGSGLDKSLLPQPVYSPDPGLVDLYWAAWDLAWGRVKHQDGIPQSPYMDENLWDDTIWIWDTEFMVLFCRYAPSLFPGIQSLDNFYKTILDGEPVSLKIWHPDNPPFFAWVEYEYYKMTGDKRRLEYVLEDNRYLQRHFYWFEKLKRGGSRFPRCRSCWNGGRKGICGATCRAVWTILRVAGDATGRCCGWMPWPNRLWLHFISKGLPRSWTTRLRPRSLPGSMQ